MTAAVLIALCGISLMAIEQIGAKVALARSFTRAIRQASNDGARPTPRQLMAGNLQYLSAKRATGFITQAEYEEGLESVLNGGAINVPKARRT